VALVLLNSPQDDVDPYLFPDGTRILFASNREGGAGGLDLYSTVLSGTTWLAPEPLADLATPHDERSPTAGDHGFALYFSSERPLGGGFSDVYLARSRELFALPGQKGIADIIAQILLLLLLLLALMAVLANRWKNLDIVVKCILFSILVHLLLLLWFRTLALTGALDQTTRPGRSHRIRFVPRETDRPSPEANVARGDASFEPERVVARAVETRRAEPALPELLSATSAAATSPALARAPRAASSAVRQEQSFEQVSRLEARSPQRLDVTLEQAPALADPVDRPVEARVEVVRAEGPRASTGTAPTELTPLSLQDTATLPVQRASVTTPVAPASRPPVKRRDGTGALARTSIDPAAPEPLRLVEGELPAVADPAVADLATAIVAAGRQDATSTDPVPRSEPLALVAPSSSRSLEPVAIPLPRSVTAEEAGHRVAADPSQWNPVARAEPTFRSLELPEVEEPPGLAREADVVARPVAEAAPITLERGAASEPVELELQRSVDLALPFAGRVSPAGQTEKERDLPEYRELPYERARPTPSLVRSETNPLPGVAELSLPVPDEDLARKSTASTEPEPLLALVESTSLGKRDVFTVSRMAMDLSPMARAVVPIELELGHHEPSALDVKRQERPDIESLYAGRTEAGKRVLLEEYGGSEESELAVKKGLAYLAKIQNRDGSWGNRRHEDSKYGQVAVGKSGLALLAFLASGHTHFSETNYSTEVRRAIDFLLSVQDQKTGHFGKTSSYSHGIATYAMAEAFAMTRDVRLRDPLVYAVAWILYNQYIEVEDPRWAGGWGYYYPDDRPVPDRWPRASVTSWQVMALKSARIGGLDIPEKNLRAARAYLRNSFDSRGWFRYTHDPDRLRSSWPFLPASTPASIFGLLLLGEDPSDPRIQSGIRFVLDRTPRRYRRASDDDFVLRGQGNLYYWYYSTLALFMVGGEEWQAWNVSLRDMLVEAQNDDGSWSPISPYSRYADESERDRTYSTAMNVLSLEIYYRYFPPLLREGR
jgi:hypothetical protein